MCRVEVNMKFILAVHKSHSPSIELLALQILLLEYKAISNRFGNIN